MGYTPIDEAIVRSDAELADWATDGSMLQREFRCSTFRAAGALASAVASIADELDHHPDIDVRYPGVVRVTTTTHATGGLTTHDLALARAINALAVQYR